MTLTEFRRIPFLRSFPSIDPETGDVFLHEVRRDPVSGLTLTTKIPVEKLSMPAT